MTAAPDVTTDAVVLTEADAIALARRVADTIHDPCGMAVGVTVGLGEMGLIRSVVAEPEAGGWHVRLHMRLTSPGCQYFFSFDEQLQTRLATHPGIARVTLDWDQIMDWTPEDMSAAARARVANRTRTLRLVPRG